MRIFYSAFSNIMSIAVDNKKKDGLNRNTTFSHPASTILVKLIHPFQNISPLTSRSKEKRMRQRQKKKIVPFGSIE